MDAWGQCTIFGPSIPWLCMQQSARFTHALHQQHSRLSTENQAVTTFTLRGQQMLYHDAHTHTHMHTMNSIIPSKHGHVQQMETLLDTQTQGPATNGLPFLKPVTSRSPLGTRMDLLGRRGDSHGSSVAVTSNLERSAWKCRGTFGHGNPLEIEVLMEDVEVK